MDRQYSVPILFLIFNRPDTTQKVFNQIKKIRPKYLYVAADGPRAHVEGEKEKSDITRHIIEQVDWDCEIKTLYRNENLGCKIAVSSAITWFFNNVEEGVILEDDCYPDMSFFEFCQVLLEKYRYDDNIYCISGNYYQDKSFSEWASSYYFSKYSHIWGWASWKRVWAKYDVEMKDYNEKTFENRSKTLFNSEAEKKYWEKIFARCSAGLVNTWDYQFLYTIWKNEGISITPTKNLVINLGLQNNSTHFFLEDSYKSGLKYETMAFPLMHPKEIKIDRAADNTSFINLYSHSLTRIVRLLKENKIRSILRYYKFR